MPQVDVAPTDPQDPRNGAIIACDFDGTITTEDLGLATMHRFAVGDWWSLELQWRNREIGSSECLQRQFAMVKASEDELRAFYQQAPVDQDFVHFAAACRKLGLDLVILSDGLDLYIRIVLERLGLADLPCFANQAHFEAGALRLGFPHRAADCSLCGNCKRDHVRRLARHYATIAYIGDGYSDRCVAGHVRPLFAKGHLREHCQEHGIPFTAFDTFRDLLPLPAAISRLAQQPGC
jgi:2,3-diketo-5-methylthio-1-phosphopentane phosphatase